MFGLDSHVALRPVCGLRGCHYVMEQGIDRSCVAMPVRFFANRKRRQASRQSRSELEVFDSAWVAGRDLATACLPDIGRLGVEQLADELVIFGLRGPDRRPVMRLARAGAAAVDRPGRASSANPNRFIAILRGDVPGQDRPASQITGQEGWHLPGK